MNNNNKRKQIVLLICLLFLLYAPCHDIKTDGDNPNDGRTVKAAGCRAASTRRSVPTDAAIRRGGSGSFG